MKLTTLKQFIILAIVMIASINTYAIPAKRIWRTVTLTDGTKVEAMLVGDEHGHWLVDHNGKALATNDDGEAFYMNDTEFTERKEHHKERTMKANAARVANISKTRALASQATASRTRKTFGNPTTIIGQKKGLVILVNFSDKSFKSANNQALFNRRFNEVGYSDNGYVGSVHDYFYDQSYGKFDLQFDVVGPVTVSKTHNYYGANDKNGDDKYPATMVIEALKLVDSQVNFKDYDWDGDGEADQVFVIYAGTGEAASSVDNDIWPHECTLSEEKTYGDGSGALTLDGVKIDTYACSCELGSSTTIDGIGCACHEFSHCLGYADLYDIDYSGGAGMESWDLLDSGSYNGPNGMGEVPPAYTSFERWWAGWMDLTVLDKSTTIKDMPALNDTAVAYKIVNDAFPSEYYLLENRQAKKWDLYTAGNGNGTGHGMLILHVNYNQSLWEANIPNDDPNFQCMTFFPADNSYGTKGGTQGMYQWYETYVQAAGDTYPGTSNNTSFTDTSTPSATLYNTSAYGTKKMGKPITDIKETNGLISFKFMGGVQAPEVTSVSAVSTSSFTASWSNVDNVKSYTVRAIPYIPKQPSQCLLMNETFDKISGTSLDISSKLDTYLDNSGWTAYKVFSNEKSIRVSSNTYNGYLVSPVLNCTSGNLTVAVKAKKYSSTESSSVLTYLCNSSGVQQKAVNLFTLPSSYETNVFSCDASGSCKLKFMFTKRGYVDDIEIYDGKFTADEINSSSSTSKALAATLTTSGDTIIVSGLTDSSYTFTGLTAENYYFQVKALYNDGSESDWTSEVLISLSPTTINTVITDGTSSDNRIFNLSGQMLGKDFSVLPKGIYIRGGRKIIKR